MKDNIARMGFMKVEFESVFKYMKGLSRLKKIVTLKVYYMPRPSPIVYVIIKAQID